MFKKLSLFILVLFLLSACKASLDVQGLDGLSAVSPEFNFLIKTDQQSTKTLEPYNFSLYVSQLDFSSKGTVYRFIPDISNTDGYFIFENGTSKIYQRKDWIEVKYSNFINSQLKMTFIPTEPLTTNTPVTVSMSIICLDTQNKKSITQTKSFIINP